MPPSAEADLRLSTFALRCWHALTQLDGPMWLSLRRLLACPGRAAAEHFEPGSALRVHPFRLYLAVNVLFFFLAPRMNVNDPDFTLNVWTFDFACMAAALAARHSPTSTCCGCRSHHDGSESTQPATSPHLL
ncbi:MAG: DUF3667 domain-containing protein, partial [Acidobacteriota bacterium]